MEHSPRLSIKAIIVVDGRLLTLRAADDSGDWYCLPGGGQQHGESIAEALQRECMEEIGVDVEIGPLRFVRDYIGRNHEFAEDYSAHQVELMFECTLRPGKEPTIGSTPDPSQRGIAWLALASLSKHRLYPRAIIDRLRGVRSSAPVYLGDVN